MIIAGDNHIAVNNCNSAQVYHNTTGGTGVGVYLAGTNNNITLLNNIFHSQLNVAFRSVQQILNLTLDNNIYYRANAGTLAEYIGNHADLAAWKTAQPTLNVNSLQGNVNFVSNSDLHVIGQLANNVGLNLANITSDFDGETRPMAPSTIVDIGADEFTPKVLDATVTAFYEPIFNCGNTSTSVSVVVRNLGSATISTLPVTVLATGGLTATLSSNFSVSLPFGAIDTLLVGTLNTANLTAPVTLTAFAQLSNDEDNGNDTLVRQLYFIPTQPQPLPAAVVCPTATTDTLFATPLPGVTYGWFASQSATTPVDTGNAFGYNPMLQTDWYLGYAPLALDVLSTSTNLANNYNGGVMFNIQAKKNIAIDSISVVSGYPMGTNFLFEVYYIANSLVSGNEQDPNPWILHETITATSTGIPQRLALTTPLTIAAGTHYAMYLAYPCYAVPVTTTTPQVFSNSSLIITPGNALLSKFNYTIPNKQFSGSIYTHEIECSTTRTLVQTQFNPDTAFASFTTQVSQPNKVDVNASASNGQLVNWLFGDGGSATGAIATHIYTTGGSYTILCTVTDTVCNTVDTATFTVQMTIGIDENELANRVNIYPNPSTGIFMVSLNMPQQQDEVGVEVLDALGRTVQKTTVVANGNTTEFTLNLTEQPTGLYMVRLHFGHAVVVKKVTKQ
jgi:PKD repeat protein